MMNKLNFKIIAYVAVGYFATLLANIQVIWNNFLSVFDFILIIILLITAIFLAVEHTNKNEVNV